FHQKRVPASHPPYVDEVPVSFPSGHSTVFAIVDNAAALAWVANLGCIELHTWHSRVPELEKPDYLLIDLDPSDGNPWEWVRVIASAYSVRPTPDARVSAPLLWEEVAGVQPEAFTIETMRARVEAIGDPMRGMWRRAASLASRFERLGLEPPA